MEKTSATTIFESLSSGIRLDIYRLLIKKGLQGMVAGEIASALALPATNLSFHLKALTQARMITVEQEGRFLRYRANLPLMLDLIAYLTAQCCADECTDLRQAPICPPTPSPTPSPAHSPPAAPASGKKS
jgi:ArsR family transcriptional regulator